MVFVQRHIKNKNESEVKKILAGELGGKLCRIIVATSVPVATSYFTPGGKAIVAFVKEKINEIITWILIVINKKSIAVNGMTIAVL